MVAGEKVHVKKGDLVEVISGKYRGKRGKVLRVFPQEGRVIVEGVNVVKRHVRPSQKFPQGGIIEQEAPIYAAKVMLVCTKCGRRTRVGRAFLEDGTKIRVCKKCGEQIDRK
ncbi:MAG: 50S ribosomal protein L24 [Armatimonadota bacterium]|nr:50S ribosomal protein L24 [Armatimonadota bacterium]MDR5702364.1 50S ribosomal protein L24 [Armatimonadota bacterium]MDR7435457.1 50S ribosomal protein L24 [Armatimonadota bacterium]